MAPRQVKSLPARGGSRAGRGGSRAASSGVNASTVPIDAQKVAGLFAGSPNRKAAGQDEIDRLPERETPPEIREQSLRERNMAQQLRDAEERVSKSQVTIDAKQKDIARCEAHIKEWEEYSEIWDEQLEDERAAALKARKEADSSKADLAVAIAKNAALEKEKKELTNKVQALMEENKHLTEMVRK